MRLLKKLSQIYMNSKIGTKQLLAYVVIVLIPTLGFSYYSFVQIANNVKSTYATNNQQILEQSYANLRGELSRSESVFQMFQYNPVVTNFINGYYTSPSDEMYAFLSDIRPLFGYGEGIDKNIQNITIYTDIQPLVNYAPYIQSSADLSNTPIDILDITPETGRWLLDTRDGVFTLQYYQALYDSGFYKRRGYLVLTLRNSSLLDNFDLFSKRQILLFRKGSEWLEPVNGQLREINTANSPAAVRDFLASPLSKIKSGTAFNQKIIVNSVNISQLGIDAVVVTPTNSLMETGKEYSPLIYLACLLFLLSLVYYAIISSLTNRIRKMARHIGKADHENLLAFECPCYRDEIGTLVTAYNNMISRIGSLLNGLNIAELKKKESDFYALQAQVKPHFIFNALETIRMMAETNDDRTVADAIYSLGRFMRYNLSRNKSEVFLKEEIENVRNYLRIYKIGMGYRLEYSIHVGCEIDGVKCPAFILQPLVENSLHHGFSDRRGKCILEIDVQQKEENLVLSVSDNGDGIDAKRLEIIRGILSGAVEPGALFTEDRRHGNGVGIVNVSERIQHYFGGNAGLTVSSLPNERTTFTITFQKMEA